MINSYSLQSNKDIYPVVSRRFSQFLILAIDSSCVIMSMTSPNKFQLQIVGDTPFQFLTYFYTTTTAAYKSIPLCTLNLVMMTWSHRNVVLF